jgi:hypothetical protein
MQAVFSVVPSEAILLDRPCAVQRVSVVQLGRLWSVNQGTTDAEESPLLRFVSRKHCRGIAIVSAVTT